MRVKYKQNQHPERIAKRRQESGDFVMSGNCEIETNCNTGGEDIPKYFCSSIPTGGVARSRRNRKQRAAPRDLHPKSLSKKRKKKKQKLLLYHDAHFSLSWNRTYTYLAVFRQKRIRYHSHLLHNDHCISSSWKKQFHFSIPLSRIESRFLDFIGLRFLVVETRVERTATSELLVKSRASISIIRSHPLAQQISRVYDSSVERQASPIEQIPPLPPPHG